MAPLPANNTSVLFTHYRANAREHVMQIRYNAAGAPSADFVNLWKNFLTSINNLMPTDYTWLGWEYRPAGSNFASLLSTAGPTLAGTIPLTPSLAPSYMHFIGRSLGGRRVRLAVLGAGLDPAGGTSTVVDYRLTETENAVIASALGALAALDAIAIDAQSIVWKPYANLGYNSYWQKQMRG